MTTDLHRFDIDVDPVGRGPVIVDGRDVSPDLIGVSVSVQRGTPTRLALYTDAPGKIVGEGIIEIHATGTDTGAVVRALDPAEVSRRIAAATEFAGVEDDPTITMLAVVAAMVDETQP